MVDLNGFDAEVVEPTSDFETLPKGDYLAIMIDSEWKDTKAGSGKYLQLTWEIVDGEFKGRRLWDRLNLQNQNDTAVKIAQGTLSAICRAVGVMRPKDSCELYGKPIVVKVDVEERNDKPGVFKNEVKKYLATGDKQSTPQAAPASKPPWKK